MEMGRQGGGGSGELFWQSNVVKCRRGNMVHERAILRELQERVKSELSGGDNTGNGNDEREPD